MNYTIFIAIFSTGIPRHFHVDWAHGNKINFYLSESSISVYVFFPSCRLLENRFVETILCNAWKLTDPCIIVCNTKKTIQSTPFKIHDIEQHILCNPIFVEAQMKTLEFSQHPLNRTFGGIFYSFFFGLKIHRCDESKLVWNNYLLNGHTFETFVPHLFSNIEMYLNFQQIHANSLLADPVNSFDSTILTFSSWSGAVVAAIHCFQFKSKLFYYKWIHSNVLLWFYHAIKHCFCYWIQPNAICN